MILRQKQLHQLSENARIIERNYENAYGNTDIQFHAQEQKKFLFLKWWVNCEEINILAHVDNCGDFYIPVTYSSYELAKRVLVLKGKVKEEDVV